MNLILCLKCVNIVLEAIFAASIFSKHCCSTSINSLFFYLTDYVSGRNLRPLKGIVTIQPVKINAYQHCLRIAFLMFADVKLAWQLYFFNKYELINILFELHKILIHRCNTDFTFVLYWNDCSLFLNSNFQIVVDLQLVFIGFLTRSFISELTSILQ